MTVLLCCKEYMLKIFYTDISLCIAMFNFYMFVSFRYYWAVMESASHAFFSLSLPPTSLSHNGHCVRVCVCVWLLQYKRQEGEAEGEKWDSVGSAAPSKLNVFFIQTGNDPSQSTHQSTHTTHTSTHSAEHLCNACLPYTHIWRHVHPVTLSREVDLSLISLRLLQMNCTYRSHFQFSLQIKGKTVVDVWRNMSADAPRQVYCVMRLRNWHPAMHSGVHKNAEQDQLSSIFGSRQQE